MVHNFSLSTHPLFGDRYVIGSYLGWDSYRIRGRRSYPSYVASSSSNAQALWTLENYIQQYLQSILLLPNQTRHKLTPTPLLRRLLLHKASTNSRRVRRVLPQHNPRAVSGESRPGRGPFELERVRVSRAHE
jgi:hypothetical protein